MPSTEHSKASKKAPSANILYACRYDIGIQDGPEFQCALRVAGPGDANLKKIEDRAKGVRLKLRGKGSGRHHEVLHLLIGAPTLELKERAEELVRQLLKALYGKYTIFRQERGFEEVVLGFHCIDIDPDVLGKKLPCPRPNGPPA